jgi:two-component system LytT family response regulator
MFTLLICEDEVENAKYLMDILKEVQDVRVVGHAPDGETAVKMVKEYSPDAVLMDIGLPDMNGLKAVELIKNIDPNVFIVITTAYTGYALDAYKLYAYDYILKPYDEIRIRKTLDNMIKIKRSERAAAVFQQRKGSGRMVIKTRDEIIFVDQRDIIMLERDETKSCIYTKDEVFETYDSLNALEGRLDRDIFFRSHRGYIVNLYYIDRIVNYGRKVYTIKLKHIEKEALISYSRINDLEALINQNSYSRA